MLPVTLLHGPGALSVDALLQRFVQRARSKRDKVAP
jgi:hypothetical protein